jgi:aryl-alcohol dehydrogenase-like predicted oxidoreductase
VEKTVEGSLKRLRTDCLDLLQFHTWSRAFNARDEWKECVRRMRDAGKIRWAGISAPNRGEECVIGALESGLIESVQLIYNVFQARVARTVFPEVRKRGLAIIVRVPLMEGALTGKFTTDTRFPDGDFRAEYFAGNKLAATVERVAALHRTARDLRPQMPLAELALRFTVSHPAVTTVIPGIRNVEQARANIACGDGATLTRDELARLAAHEWDVDLWSLESV